MLYNVEAEEAVLGCCLSVQDDGVDIASAELTSADFYREIHQVIFDVLLEMRARGESINVLTVFEHVRGRTIDMPEDEIRTYLVNIVELASEARVYDLKAIAENAKIVKSYSERRLFSQAALKALSDIKRPDISVEDVKTDFTSKIERLASSMGLECVREIADKDYDSLTNYRKRAASSLYPTLPTLDAKFGRFGDSQFILLKAPRGSGKTHIMIDWGFKCANFGRTAVIYSLEMPKNQLIKRMIAHEGKFDSAIFKRLDTADIDEWSAINDGYALLREKNIFIRDEAGVYIETIASEVRHLKIKGFDIGFIGIDFAELVGTKRTYQSKEQQLFDIGAQLRNISADLACTVVLLSQVNETGGERYSRGLGNLCDLLLSWKCLDGNNRGHFYSEKNRFGESFKIDVDIDKKTSRLVEVTSKYGDLSQVRSGSHQAPTSIFGE